MPRHIMQTIKSQIQRKKLKAAKERQQITHKGIPIRLTAELSAKTANQKGMAGHI